MADLEFRLLGPVAAMRNGDSLPLGGPRQRALLALLLLDPGQPATADWLVHELWQGRPPAGASTTLRSYVSRLRNVLGGEAFLTGSTAGYALEVARDRIDARRFEQLAREGDEALSAGRPRRAERRLRAALELWQARPFADLADEGALRLEAERLDQIRQRAVEGRIEADLALGRGAELVEELEALVQENPYRERLWRQLMLALYRADRQADALAAYRRARELLDEELGLEPSEELRRLEQAILRHDVPPAVAPDERHNLPAPVSSFVGREAELADVARLLSESRLVTLTGVGGVGKTRLAVAAAARAAADFADGAVFVDLSGLVDPGRVAAHVAGALDVREQPDTSVADQLGAGLRDAELLLVLDNCEHLAEPVAELAEGLLARCPELRVLATSRERLGVGGEVDWPVPPLALPAPDADPEELRSSEAVRLFLARARDARPALDEDSALASAAAICRDLDGLPLAIELAAARAKALSLEEIAARLADRFRFLVSWRRLTTARHRTLREAMDWSYGLLSEEERTLLARFSVFSGGFTLAAVERVSTGGVEAGAFDLLGRLVEASLVVPEEHGVAMRYRLLETVREYAAERLREAGDEAEVRRRHAEWCLALAEEAEPQLTGEQQITWLTTLELERGNLQAALTYLSTEGDHDAGLRLAVALSRFWYVRGHLGEGRRWLGQALADGEAREPTLRRRAFTAAASLALLQGDYAEATTFAERALVAAQDSGEPTYVANALSNLGAIVLAAGDHARAGGLLEEAVTLAREVGDPRIHALAVNNLGDLALTVGDYARAEPLFEESLELLIARGDTANVARALFNLGAVALKLGRLDDAEDRFGRSIAAADEAGDKEDLVWCLEGLAGLAAARGRGRRAAVLLGAAGALLEEIGAEFKPFERQLHEATEERALELCGDEAFTAAGLEGSGLGLAGAVEYALAREEH